MGWAKGTDVMDAAVRAMTMTAAEVFQVAAGMEGAKTPALVNWLNDDPANSAKLDDQMRRGVALVAGQLRNCGWDSPEEAADFERFSQEMLGHTDEQHASWLADNYNLADSPREVHVWGNRLREHNRKGRKA